MRCRLRSSVLSHGTRHQHSHTFKKGPILNRVPAFSKQLTELYVVRHTSRYWCSLGTLTDEKAAVGLLFTCKPCGGALPLRKQTNVSITSSHRILYQKSNILISEDVL